GTRRSDQYEVARSAFYPVRDADPAGHRGRPLGSLKDRHRRGGDPVSEGTKPGQGSYRAGGDRGGPVSAPATDAVSTPETGAPGGAVVRAIYRDGAGNMHVDWPPEKIPEAVRDQGGTLWADFMAAKEEGTREVETWLQEVFPFHHLAVEDAL